MTQVESSWDEYAEDWDADEGARAYAEAAFECLERLASDRSVRLVGARVLDFGCGTGLLTERLVPVCSLVMAVDTSARMIDTLRHKIDRLGLANVHTSTEAIEHDVRDDAGLVGRPFDVVVCSSVCAFLDDYAGTVATLVRLLRPGGLFVQWDWELDPHAEESFGLTRQQVASTLSGSGLEAVHVGTAFEVPMEEKTVRPLVGVGQAPGG